jgi:hypothetical protein
MKHASGWWLVEHGCDPLTTADGINNFHWAVWSDLPLRSQTGATPTPVRVAYLSICLLARSCCRLPAKHTEPPAAGAPPGATGGVLSSCVLEAATRQRR